MKAYSIPGLTSERDLDIICELAKTVPENGTVVEVGSFFGRTAIAFAETVHSSVDIYCIDYFNTWVNSGHVSYFHPPGDYWVPNKSYDLDEEFSKFTKEYSNIKKLKVPSNLKVYHPYEGNLIDLFL